MPPSSTNPSRPPPTASGLLAERPLAHLLAYALERRLAGSFELVDPSGERVLISVVGGLVSRVATTERVSYLGHVLYEHGLLNDSTLNTSLSEMARAKRLHGVVLVEKGILTVEQVAEGLRLQRLRKLHHAFGLAPDSRFAFYAGVELVASRPNDVEPVAPYASIWRGVAAHPSWVHVRATLQSVGDRRLRLSGLVELAALSAAELAVTQGMQTTPASLADIIARAKPGGQPGELLAYFLVITKLAVLDQASQPPVMHVTPPPPRAAPSAPPGHDAAPSSMPPASMSFTPVKSVRPKARISDEMARLIDNLPPRLAGSAPPPPVSTRPPSSTPASGTPPPVSVVPSAPPPSVQPGRASGPPARQSPAEKALAQAEMHLVLQEQSQAMTVVKKVLAQAPGLPDALVLEAYLEALTTPAGQEKPLRELLRRCNTAITQLPTCRRGRFYRAEVKRRLGDQAGAVEDLRIAAADDPSDAEVRDELHRQEKKLAETRRPSGLFGRPKQS